MVKNHQKETHSFYRFSRKKGFPLTVLHFFSSFFLLLLFSHHHSLHAAHLSVSYTTTKTDWHSEAVQVQLTALVCLPKLGLPVESKWGGGLVIWWHKATQKRIFNMDIQKRQKEGQWFLSISTCPRQVIINATLEKSLNSYINKMNSTQRNEMKGFDPHCPEGISSFMKQNPWKIH